MSKAHAFEAVLIMAGGVVNQDAALGSVYATPSAKKVSLRIRKAPIIMMNTYSFFWNDAAPMTMTFSDTSRRISSESFLSRGFPLRLTIHLVTICPWPMWRWHSRAPLRNLRKSKPRSRRGSQMKRFSRFLMMKRERIMHAYTARLCVRSVSYSLPFVSLPLIVFD